MLDEEVEEACLVVFNLGELFEDCVGDEVGAAAAGGEGELFLEPIKKYIISFWLCSAEMFRD